MIVISILSVLAVTNGCASMHVPLLSSSSRSHLSDGYGALKLFLEDEQYLTWIRRTNAVLTFNDINESSMLLIDEIADASEGALDELEQLAKLKPGIVFVEFSDESIGKATLDSLRISTAKEFLLDSADFEKNLLLSQSNILRVISHLARELEQKETNVRRKKWLKKLADRYERYYQQVFSRISIATKDKSR